MTASKLRARYWRIVRFFASVTARVIFWDILLPRLGLAGLADRNRTPRYRRMAVRFRALAIDMGGLMIKVGQFLSVRVDVLPREITDLLAGLQDEVPAEPFAAIRAKAEAELGRPLTESFASFDKTPLAAASLGQAHRAILPDDLAAAHGFADVVVKVQRPDIDRVVDTDLAALRRVAGWLRRYRPIAERADVPALVEEFARTTLEELDYLAEGRNSELFAEQFTADGRLRVPTVVWPLSTRRVLVLQDVSAIRIGDREAILAAGIDPSAVATLLVDAYRRQILEHGFFHADPHPGNLFVAPLEEVDEQGARRWQLVFIDFGMVGRVPENLRQGLREAVIAVGTQDVPRLVQSYRTLGVLLPGADLARIELAGTQLFDRFWGMSMSELGSIDYEEIARFGHQFRDLIADLPFQLPQNLLMMGRAVGILSGLATTLDPDFNVWAVISPYATRMVEEQTGPLWKTVTTEGSRLLQTALTLPGRTDRVLTAAERGELAVRTPQLARQVAYLERSMNRVAGAVAFAALMVAGALVLAVDPGLGRLLMGGSALPLIWALFFARGHRPRP